MCVHEQADPSQTLSRSRSLTESPSQIPASSNPRIDSEYYSLSQRAIEAARTSDRPNPLRPCRLNLPHFNPHAALAAVEPSPSNARASSSQATEQAWRIISASFDRVLWPTTQNLGANSQTAPHAAFQAAFPPSTCQPAGQTAAAAELAMLPTYKPAALGPLAMAPTPTSAPTAAVDSAAGSAASVDAWPWLPSTLSDIASWDPLIRELLYLHATGQSDAHKREAWRLELR